MSNWTFRGREIKTVEDMPEGAVGFIYKISSDEGNYIGKKSLFSTRTIKPSPRFPKKRKVTKESDWRTYFSSLKDSDLPKQWKSGEVPCTREIIHFAFSKMDMTYLETKYLFSEGVLESDEFLNKNILGKFYWDCMTKKCLEYAG